MSIEKDKENPRKDYEKCADVLDKIKFFYEPYFTKIVNNGLPYNDNIDKNVIIDVLKDFASSVDYSLSEQEWFNNLKILGTRHKFAESNKIYKQNKEAYLGSINDVAEMVRISLTGSKQSPNIYYILRILKEEEINRRIQMSIDILSK